jgi:hypothetical protein
MFINNISKNLYFDDQLACTLFHDRTYFYKLEVGQFTQVKKIILIK